MAKYYRCNMMLGIIYEIPEKLALKKINNRHWVRGYDHELQEFCDYWINTKDINRDMIYKSE